MTKSTITRERVVALIAEHSYDSALVDDLEHLLAAMDSEPVAVTDDELNAALQLHRLKVDGHSQLSDSFLAGFRYARRTTPQPAPVVPEEMTPEMMRSVQLNSELGAYAASNLSGAYDLFAEFWKVACRAAMLAAAPQSPGSEPSTVQGKWIPVSEQMPEDEQEVLTINKMGHRFVSFFDKHSGLFFDRLDAPAACSIEHVLVTHWMPLPAAQQEVKSE